MDRRYRSRIITGPRGQHPWCGKGLSMMIGAKVETVAEARVMLEPAN
jgi:hypothetical protein